MPVLRVVAVHDPEVQCLVTASKWTTCIRRISSGVASRPQDHELPSPPWKWLMLLFLKLQIDIELSFTYYIIDERSSPNSFWVISYTFFRFHKNVEGWHDKRRETRDKRRENRGERRATSAGKTGPAMESCTRTDRQTDRQTNRQTNRQSSTR
jgi:hypothetical protein